MAKAKQPPPRFAGFDKSAMAFWHELAMEMNKEWFTENKQRYEDQWVQPLTTLLAEVTAGITKAYAPVKLAEPKVLRIYRDVRFAKDKTPYKTHIAGATMTGASAIGPGGTSAVYIHIGAEEEFIGVGTYYFDAKRLAKWRKQVAGKPGADLAKLVTKLRAKGYAIGGHDDYKKVPKPYAADHERAEFLKMRGLTGSFPEIPRGLLHKPGLADWIIGHAIATAPLVTWLHKHVG
jgi:uncharacterized protein (TIGR02453 family)